MPPRTNAFQRLILMIEHQLAPAGARVTESKIVMGREIDVAIEARSGVHDLLIAVECIDRKRRADSPWIESLFGKYDDLRRAAAVHKVIAVSRSGFAKTALKSAGGKGIETLTLGEAHNADWSRIVGSLREITVRSIVLPRLTGVNVIVDDRDGGGAPAPDDARDAMLYTPSGEPRKSLAEFVDEMLNSREMLNGLEEAQIAGYTKIEGERVFTPGSYIVTAAGTRHVVHSLKVEAKAYREESVLRLKSASYRSANVASAQGTSLQHPFVLIFVENETQGATVGFSIMERPNTGRTAGREGT